MSVPAHLQQHPMFSGARFGIMSADAPRFTPMLEGHENLIRTLKDMDLDHIQTHGKWSGVPERSVIIKNPTREQMENLGRTFGQEAVVYSEDHRHQLLHTNGPDAGKTLGAKLDGNPVDFFTEPPDDNYTHLPGHGYFRINFDFGGEPESPMVKPMVKAEALEKRSKNVRNWTRYENGGEVIPAGEAREGGGIMTYGRDQKRPLSDDTKQRRAQSLLQKLGIVPQPPKRGFTPIRTDEQGKAVVTPSEGRTTALHEAGHVLSMPKGRTVDQHQQWMTGSFKQQMGTHAIDELAADKVSAGLARRAGIAPSQDDNYATYQIRSVEKDLKKPKLPKTESKYRKSHYGPGKVVREDYSNLKTNMTDHPQKQMYVAGLHNPVEYAKAREIASKRLQAVDEGRLAVKEGKLSFAQRSPILRRSKIRKAELMPGGKGDGRPDSDFDPKELAAGVKAESEEHGLDAARAKEVAKDHLTEDARYYSKLKTMEKAQDTPESLAAWDKWKQEQTKYSPDEQVWQDHMGDIAHRVEHGVDNPAATTEHMLDMDKPPRTATWHAVNENAKQWEHYDRNNSDVFYSEPASTARNYHGGPLDDYDMGKERGYWEGVERRSPLLRRSRNKLVHKAEAYTDAQGNTQFTGAPRTGGTIAPPKLTTFGQYAQSKGLGGHISQQTPGAITVDKTKTSPGRVSEPTEPTVNWRARSPVMKRSGTGLTKSNQSVAIRDLLHRGAVGRQGWNQENMARLIQHIHGPEFNVNRPMSEVFSALRAPEHQQKQNDFMRMNPIQVSRQPDGTLHLEDGHHRGNLTYFTGGAEIPAVVKTAPAMTKTEQISGVNMHPHAYPWHDWNDEVVAKADNKQDTPESLAAWGKWKKEQTKYSPDEQVWQDHMGDIAHRVEHGIDNPAAVIEGRTVGGNFDNAGVARAIVGNRKQKAHYGFGVNPVDPQGFSPAASEPVRPLQYATELNTGHPHDVFAERSFWHDVERRSPLLRRSRNKLVHKAEAPIVNDQHAPQGTSDHYRRLASPYGNIAPVGQPGSTIRHYPLEGRHMAVDKMLHDHGYAHYYAGGKYGKPDLAKKNYETGHLMIYDPEPGLGGDFGTRQYTDTWRKSHELAHALTLKEVNGLYGEGRRMGKLGTHRSLNEAMRAVHWEWLAAHKQRELLAGVGVNVPDETFHKELNTVMHDAVHRAVTGKFTDPEMERFIPHGYKIPLSVSLDQLRNEAEKLGLQKADPWKSNAELVAHLETKGDVHGVMRDALLESGYQENRHNVKDPKNNPGYNPGGLDAWDRTLAANDANRVTGTNASEPSGHSVTGKGAHRFSPGVRDAHFWEDVDKDPNPYSDAQLETIPEEVRARSPILSRSRFTKAEGRFQAAFRDLKTGKITPTRYYHEAAELPGWHEGMSDEEVENKWESGWIDSKGKWFTRVQAAKAAGHPEPLDSTNYGYGQSDEDPKFVSARSPILKRSKKSRT